jgi:DNA-binding GntR family transcriptional regulator
VSDRDTLDASVVPSPGSGASSLSDQAYAELEERLVTLRLAPGEVLSEQTLAAELGLGRTPIREALQRLAVEGLVSVLPRKGILVSRSEPANQLLVLEVRRELERLLSVKAAERATAEQRRRFTAIADGMDAAAASADGIAFMRLDHELNGLVVAAAHNAYAARAMRLIAGHSRRFWYQHYQVAADLPLCARLHAAQARAVAAGEATVAGEAADQLIDYTETFTRAAASRR